MKIMFTGGGSSGHFYPIIAVAKSLKKILNDEKFVGVEFYYVSNKPHNQDLLDKHNIKFKKNATGKLRRYFSLKNFSDVFKTFFSMLRSFGLMYLIFPDVVFSKGGYPSVPVTLAAWFFTIPVIIHESDAYPGLSNKIASKFAKKIAISHPEVSEYLPKEKLAFTGNPIREELMEPVSTGSHAFFQLEENLPVIFILGGSQGAKIINDVMLNAIPKLLENYQVIHQVGPKNLDEYKPIMDVALHDSLHKNRYKPFGYLNAEQMRRAAGVSDLVVSRGGSTIFEIAIWGIPSIVLPISNSSGDHQRKNAFSYARTGACEVINESNLTPNLFVAEVNRIFNNPELMSKMREGTKKFAKRDAADKIAIEIMKIVRGHYGITE